jgi:hypothetical protein
MSDSYSNADSAPLDVEVYLHVEQGPDTFRCEIIAGTPTMEPQTLYDPTREVLVTAEAPSMAHFTLVTPRGKRRGVLIERRALTRLAEWIAAVLRQVIDSDRAAVIALARTPGSKGLHWLIAPMREGAASSISATLLGMDQGVVILTDGAAEALAGHLRRALA